MMKKIIIVIADGMVEKVLIPKGANLEVEVLDFDNDWFDEDEQNALGDELETLENSGEYEIK